MKVTNATKEACEAIRMIRQGDKWVLVHPYYPGQLQGPSTHSQPDSYDVIREQMANCRASLVMHLMGVWTLDIEFLIEETRGNLNEKIAAALRYHREVEIPHLAWMNQA